MATIEAPTILNTEYSGEAPSAFAHGQITLASAQIDDKVRLNRLFAGTKVMDARLVNAALGASVTIDLGFEYVDGESGGNATQWLAAQACTSAGSNRTTSAPVVLQYDAYIIATVKGAAATGLINSIIQYEYRGK